MRRRRRQHIGSGFFNASVIISSIASFILGVGGIVYFIFFENITNFRPYMIFTLILLMGIMGYRAWSTENID